MEGIVIKNKIISSVVIITLVLFSMTIFNIYQERKLIKKYENLSLNKFKKNSFKFTRKSKSKYSPKIKVHISGAVRNPGFFQVTQGCTLKQLIDRAIIIKKNANLVNLNLERKLKNRDNIIIPYN